MSSVFKTKYTKQQMREKLVSMFCTGDKAMGMRVWDIMAYMDIPLDDEYMKNFIIEKLKYRDSRISKSS
jgi:hypothetical protein